MNIRLYVPILLVLIAVKYIQGAAITTRRPNINKANLNTDRALMHLLDEGYYIEPIPVNKCFTFKIKTAAAFFVAFGTLNKTEDFDDTYHLYLGATYNNASKKGEYSGLYDVAKDKYIIDDKPTPNLLNQLNYREFYVTWHNNILKVGLVGAKPFIDSKLNGKDLGTHIGMQVSRTADLSITNNKKYCSSKPV